MKELRDPVEVAAILLEPAEVELRPLGLRKEFALPQAPMAYGVASRSLLRRHWLFLLTVAAPLLCAALYLFAVASPRFASEASFIIRSTDNGGEGASLAAMAQSSGTSRAIDETYAVNDYLSSRDVLELLVAKNDLRGLLSRPGADAINRFPTFWVPNDNERLYRRFNSMVSATVDDETGISTLEVNAFTPDDAQAIAVALLGYAEAMVNKLNDRAYQDAVSVAGGFVDRAMADLRSAEGDLDAYREQSGVVDPNLESDATLRTIESLAVELAQTHASIDQQTKLAPNAPQIEGLRQQASAYEKEIARLKQEMAGASSSLAGKMAKFEELALRREIAAKSLENAVMSLNKAREDVARQHLYVQVITRPNRPDIAKYPRRFLDLLAVAAIALAAFFVLRGFRDVALEHR